MTYFNDVNLGLPAEAYEAPGTENHDILYPVISQVYVPETQLYNVVHAVEYHGTTYFFENLIELPVYRLCNVINYSPANVVDENSSYRSYWPTETVYSGNVEHDFENTPEYDNQPSDGEILSAESNEAMSESMDINNFYSPGHDLITTNYDNSWSTTSVHSQYGINEPSTGIREDGVIHYSEAYENRSLGGIVLRNEINLDLERMNHRWPNVRNGCCLNDGSCQEPILDSVHSQEIAGTSAVNTAVKFKKENLYLIALSGKLCKKESLPVVDKMPDIQEVNEENSVIEYNNENAENASQNEAVLHSDIFTEQFKKVCRRKSVQIIKKMEVIQKVSDNAHRVELKCENVLKVKKIDSVVQGNILTPHSKKLYRRENIQVFDKVPDIEEVADDEYVVGSSNKNIVKIKRPVLQTNIFTERVKNLYRKESIQVLQRMPLIKEVINEECLEEPFDNDTLKIESPAVKADIISEKAKKSYRRENIKAFNRMHVIEEIADEECLEESCIKNALKIERPAVKADIFTEKAQPLYKRERIQAFNKMPLIKEIADEECIEESCIKDALKIQHPVDKSNKFTKKANKLRKIESIQTFNRMPVIVEEADEECVVESCLKNAPKIERPVIEEVFDEKCELESCPIKESKDTDKTFDAFLDKNNQFVNQISPVKEMVKANDENLSQAFVIQKTPMVNVERISLDKVKEVKKKDNILNTGKIKSSVEKKTYEGMTLLPLKEDPDQNKSLESDIALENGNERTEPRKKEPSQKSKKKRFQNLRKFFGRLLRCCSKGPT